MTMPVTNVSVTNAYAYTIQQNVNAYRKMDFDKSWLD